MTPQEVLHTLELPNKSTIALETGFLAPQADGSVLLTMGQTRLLATAVECKETEPTPFLPLTVDYREHFFAARRIPRNFPKREGKPSTHEILISRLIDRTIRPTFPKGYHNAVQVNVSLFSIDEHILPDTLAILAASSALTLSKIPFLHPVSGVRVACVDEKILINPSPQELGQSTYDIILGGNQEQLLMLQGRAQEIDEDSLLQALQAGHEAIQAQCQLQTQFAQKVTCPPKEMPDPAHTEDLTLKKYLEEHLTPRYRTIIEENIQDKQQRNQRFSEARQSVIEQYDAPQPPNAILQEAYCAEIKKELLRTRLLDHQTRIDGRKPDEIRPIQIKLGHFSTHGDAIFTRGQTQVLSTVTLGNKLDEQLTDSPSKSGYSALIVNYNFPAFATNEVKPNRGVSRREEGHGNLIKMAIESQLPSKEENPYTIRITADTLASDGSSSMAGTAAASLALMDAGVKVKNHVAGIAMGLIYTPDKSIILFDISSDEDACGDADLKVTGTQNGITAFQMDIKTAGLPLPLLRDLFLSAKQGRQQILEKMNQAISQPRPDHKPSAPAFHKLQVPPKMIGSIIGPRGKVIQEIQQATDTDINITDDGLITLFAPGQEQLHTALQAIQKIIEEPTLHKVYTGVIKSLQPYGAFVEFMPGKEGLLHISQVSHEPIENIADALKEGDTIEVKLIDIKSVRGKKQYSLSRKELLKP